MAATIPAPPELIRSTVRDLHTHLVEANAAEPAVILDLSGITKLDTLGAQLIVAAARAGIELQGRTPVVSGVLERLGLAVELGTKETAE